MKYLPTYEQFIQSLKYKSLDLDDVNESMSYSTQKELKGLVKILGDKNFKKAAQAFASGSRTPKELYKNFMGKMDLADEGRLEDKIVRSSYKTVDFFLERFIYFLENYYMKYIKTFEDFVNESSYEMDRWKIREAIAESGKMRLKDVMDYLNRRYEGKFDVKQAKEDAKEMIKDAKKQ